MNSKILKIHHRINDIEALKKVPKEDGVEIDIHAYQDRLVVHHDPFTDSVNFEEWVKYFAHKFVILNIKEEGIEERVLEIVNKANIKDFFLLDLSFPALMKLVRNNEKRIAVRVSDYESVDNALLLSGKVEWVWIDLFNKKFPLSKQDCDLLNKSGFKLCLVSPELHKGNDVDLISQIQNFLQTNHIKIDAVCTKNVHLW